MPGPYYATAKGLRFECTQCGRCCTRPGPVYFSKADLAHAARLLGTSLRALGRRLHVTREASWYVVDAPEGRSCPFHDAERGCTIYEARPVQCRTWPFWPEVVGRRRSWERAARTCEGMNRGPRHTPAEIDAEIARSRAAGVPEGDPW